MIDRTIPQEIIDVAVLAIRRGAESVSVVHESLGAEYPAPIGWIVYIREAGETSRGAHQAIFHQVGCPLDDLTITLPSLGADASAPVVEEFVGMFIEALRNGWAVKYERDMLEHRVYKRLAERDGRDVPPMRHELELTATNWSWDEASRERDDHIQYEITISRLLGEDGSNDIVFTQHSDDPDNIWSGKHRQTTLDAVRHFPSSPPPGAVLHAYFDDTKDNWVF